jgi:hypothetical protein
VVAALPVAGFAQSQSAAQGNPAAEHLAAARAALNKVLNAPAPSGDAFKKLSELKTEYIALEKSASTASPDWASHYANIDRVVGELIGAPAAASGESGAVGTSGHAGAMKGVEPGVAADLSTFRTELKAFSTAMSAVAPASGAASTAASTSPAPAAASSTPSSAPAPATSAASPSAPTSGSVVSGTAPKSTPLQAPAAPVAASGSSATAATPTGTSGAATGTSATGTSPTAEPGLAAQLDPVIALVDAALAANPVDASGKVTVDRPTLDAIKAQLQVIKAKKQ